MNSAPATPLPNQLLRLPEVLRRLPVSRSTLYDGIKIGLYPAPIRLGKRTVAWRERDIEEAIRELNKEEVNKLN